MGRELFGSYLRRVVRLSHHDVSEILEEQGVTGRRFGEVALSLRMCQPRDVWQAWWEQLSHVAEPVNLDLVGIDTQALTHLNRSLVEEFKVIPVRSVEDQLVVAVTEENLPVAQANLARACGKSVRFVLADARQIQAAIARYYPDRSTSKTPAPLAAAC